MQRAFLAIRDPNLAAAVRHLLTSLTFEIVGSVTTWDDALEQVAGCEFDLLCIEQPMIVRGGHASMSALVTVRANHAAIVCIEAPRTHRQELQDTYADLTIRTSDRLGRDCDLKTLIEAHARLRPAKLRSLGALFGARLMCRFCSMAKPSGRPFLRGDV
ncbi:MAG: hypothetical protein R3A10_18315 [Caldilineaceae bacterium]